MKHIRKIIVAVLAIAVVASTAIVPAMAEGNAPQTGIPQMNSGMAVTGRGGFGGPGGFGGQMPGRQGGQQMPGGHQGKGQMPNGQMPDNNPQDKGQQPSQGQMPQDNNCQQMPGRMGKGFKGGRGHRDMLDLDALVKNGTLSQETRDAIDKFMSEKKEERMQSLLDELKDAGVITQEEYDAIEAARSEQPVDTPAEAPADAPEAPADAPEIPEAPADGEAPEAPAEQAETQD